jgi:hypothetical protein
MTVTVAVVVTIPSRIPRRINSVRMMKTPNKVKKIEWKRTASADCAYPEAMTSLWFEASLALAIAVAGPMRVTAAVAVAKPRRIHRRSSSVRMMKTLRR